MTDESNYATVKIPNDLASEVDQLVGSHGFKTRAEIVKQAIRMLLNEYSQQEKASQNE